jgi:hypothetical protein
MQNTFTAWLAAPHSFSEAWITSPSAKYRSAASMKRRAMRVCFWAWSSLPGILLGFYTGDGQQPVYKPPDYGAVGVYVVVIHTADEKVAVVGNPKARIQGFIPGFLEQQLHGLSKVGVFLMLPAAADTHGFDGVAGRFPQLFRCLANVAFAELSVCVFKQSEGGTGVILSFLFLVLHISSSG